MYPFSSFICLFFAMFDIYGLYSIKDEKYRRKGLFESFGINNDASPYHCCLERKELLLKDDIVQYVYSIDFWQ